MAEEASLLYVVFTAIAIVLEFKTKGVIGPARVYIRRALISERSATGTCNDSTRFARHPALNRILYVPRSPHLGGRANLAR
jgi:hypothetical protein